MGNEPKTELTVRAVLSKQGLANSDIKQGAQRGKIWLRGAPTSDLGRLVNPEDVTYMPEAPRLMPGRDLAVLFRDDDLAVVWKPSGWLSVRAPGRGGERDLVSYVGNLFGQSFVVHRLDEETSGVMMVALNERMQFEIKRLLENHDIERRYLALVKGVPTQTHWTMETTFVRNRGDGLRGSGQGEDAKRAFTQFELVEKLEGGVSLVQATLETGRTHQVRIHLAESGHPVLGDRLYGDNRSSRRCPRVALHAAVLGLKHPRTGEKLHFDIPLADDLEQLRRSHMPNLHHGREVERRGRPPKKKARKSKGKKRR